ncbi:uncharacterized protein LOC142364720 isoform X2 [Opisthocomus hoazin]|uniref:uncharacterized protein LOC142364720 isoform X2 n=1 Tax=Opisthocomus hoazin TaxID=30419 RepID=UPI003F529E43
MAERSAGPAQGRCGGRRSSARQSPQDWIMHQGCRLVQNLLVEPQERSYEHRPVFPMLLSLQQKPLLRIHGLCKRKSVFKKDPGIAFLPPCLRQPHWGKGTHYEAQSLPNTEEVHAGSTQPVLTPGMSLWFCVSEAPATIPKSGGRAINQQYFPGHSPTHPERVTWPCTNPRHRNGRGTQGPLLCRSRTEHTAARRAGGMRWGPHSPRRHLSKDGWLSLLNTKLWLRRLKLHSLFCSTCSLE